MKKAKVILRFGNTDPIPGDLLAISTICEKSGDPEKDLKGACGMSLPIGVLSIVYTDRTSAEIKEIYKLAGEEVDDILPIIVFDLYDTNVCFDFYEDRVQDMIQQFEEYHNINNKKCTHSLDELLDKIKQVGMEGLSKKELARLKSF